MHRCHILVNGIKRIFLFFFTPPPPFTPGGIEKPGAALCVLCDGAALACGPYVGTVSKECGWLEGDARAGQREEPGNDTPSAAERAQAAQPRQLAGRIIMIIIIRLITSVANLSFFFSSEPIFYDCARFEGGTQITHSSLVELLWCVYCFWLFLFLILRPCL